MGLFQMEQTELKGTVVSVKDFLPIEAQYFFGKKLTKGFASGEIGYFQPTIKYELQERVYTKPANTLYRGEYYRKRLQPECQVKLMVSRKNPEKFKIVFEKA